MPIPVVSGHTGNVVKIHGGVFHDLSCFMQNSSGIHSEGTVATAISILLEISLVDTAQCLGEVTFI